MRITRPFANCKLYFSALLICALGRIAFAAEPTALSLIKEGNDYVGKDSKDRVVQIRSEKSIGSLTPNIWFVVYYDPDATFKATEVKFGAGKKMDVKRPIRALEILNADKVLDLKKLKTDSDAAIKTATSEPLLKNLTLRATQLWLDDSDAGPVWKIRLWAAKLKNPGDDADVGDVYISAETGKETKIDLHIERVD
jgi:hypothetical protein